MKKNWEVKNLGEIIKLEYGKPLPDSKRKSDGAYPVYGANGEKDRTDEYYHDEQSIIVGRKGSAGEINLTENRFWPLDVTYFVTFDHKKYDLNFIYHFLSNLELPKLAKGVKPGINRNEVYEIRVNIPPLPEQQRIIAILDEAFAAIATAKENAEKNLQNAREIFDSYLQSVFASPGDGWEEKKLGQMGKTQYGLSETMNEHKKGFKIFRMGDVQNGQLIDTGNMKYADISRIEFEKYRLYLGDILFNRTNSYELVGKTGIFNLEDDYCFASYLIRLKLDKTLILPRFLNYFMNSTIFQSSVKKKASKSVNQSNINATMLSNEIIYFPKALPEQHRIVTKLDALSAETKKLEAIYEQKLTHLEELTKSILQKAFSGELSGE